MSKFINEIKVCLKGKEKSLFEPLKTSITEETTKSDSRMREYTIGVEFKTKVTCLPKHLNTMIESVTRELRDAVYGDLRNRIIRLERAVYSHDRKNAEMEMRDILREVWG